MGNLKYNFSMGQLEKLEEFHPNRMGKCNNADIKVSINLI